MPDLAPVRRALLSVSDKRDLVLFAKSLAERGVEILSTGGTARALEEAGVRVTHVEEVTRFPEMMGGRVKTLHPLVHGAILAVRDDPDHQEAMRAHGIRGIDLVCVNLYPFEATVTKPGATREEAVEQIDIGGPSMVRSAAKNAEHVAVVTSPEQYDAVASALETHDGATPRSLRQELAAAAFARTAEYDAAIASYLSRRAAAAFPEVMDVRHVKAQPLRYGENPHQEAALYRDPASTGQSVVNAEILHGKALSYNNILDAAAALEAVKDLSLLEPERACCVVVKHTNPCGAAVANDTRAAADAALAGDTVAAFGGILALSVALDDAAAQRLCEEGAFLEVIVAPSFEPDALARLKNRWKNVRLLAAGVGAGSDGRKIDFRSVPGGALVQTRDTAVARTNEWTLACGPAPDDKTLRAAAAIWTVTKHLKSNAVAIGGVDESYGAARLFGVGAGQVDRVTASRIAAEKAGERAEGAIAASDAFFPFPDGPALLADAGVRVIVQPGGSKRDEETLDLCRERGVTCLFTGVRHFRH